MGNLLVGYVITTVALSATDGISSIIHFLCELAVNSINLKTAQKQLAINKIASEAEKQESCIKAIGFAADLEGDEEEYDDEP